MAKAKTGGRPPKAVKATIPSVTGVRLPEDLREALDAMVAEQNERGAAEGFSTNRNALIVRLLRDAVNAWKAKAARATEGEAP